MDEYIDMLLREEIYCDVTLPRIPKRIHLEEEGVLEQRISILMVDNDQEMDEENKV
jgi:hypothetical protein